MIGATCGKIRNRLPAARRRASRVDRGFTLVELLVSISIITLLASMVLVALAGVQETAKEDRTRAQIARIDTLISEKWEQFRTRRVPMPISVRNNVRRMGFQSGANASQLRRVMVDKPRVDMVREIMRMELPDRKSDLLIGPTALPPTSVPSVWHAYRRYAASLIKQKRPNVAQPIGYTNPQEEDQFEIALDDNWSAAFQSAECLYLILSQMVDQDAKALEYFSAREIGDLDGDGMPEILDGWGRPVFFLRWAPGLNVNRNPITGAMALGPNIYPGSPQEINSPDPYDLMGVYPRLNHIQTYALYPLIASSGPDQQMEFFSDAPEVDSDKGKAPETRSRINYALTSPPNNPFRGFPGVYEDGFDMMVGTPIDQNQDGVLGWIDNITNHNLAGS